MFDWFRRLFSTSRLASAAQAHLTFGATSVGRTLSGASLLLKKQLWIWPILAVVLLAGVGYGIRVAIERTMRASLQAELQTLQNMQHAMLETWLRVQEANAQSMANDAQVRRTVSHLIDLPAMDPDAAQGAAAAALHAELARELSPGLTAHHFTGYIVADKRREVLAASNPELVGRPVDEYEALLNRVLEGETVVSPPFASVVLMKDEHGRLRTGLPTMFVLAPVRDANLQVVAALGLRIRPERDFTGILQLGQMGQTGETYAINKEGTLVSSSRFDEQLILLGLLPDLEGARSILTLSARNPGGDLTRGYRPGVRRSELPLTKAAAAAIAGESGIDLNGYADYRGVPVVGAWQWLPQYELGLITEMDHAEAYRPLTILRWAFFSLLGLLTASSAAIFVFTLILARMQREAQQAAIEARHLGQYRLEERLGEGAMGVVYRGQHAMLRRATAIKLLHVDKVNEASIQRFEREVQITCQLNHPNTVAIYDYGRTPEGVFYYAMEFLDGLDLQTLVERYGPQPEGRVVKILKQICGSLYEAHSLGLVHRDIKPANVMLNRRGGEPDVAKVLDFGLVRALDDARRGERSGGLTGTPLYMSPEAIQTPDLVDARSDLYAVGAIGYFLLTGRPVFEATSLVELCQLHLEGVPAPPSERLGRPVSAELENALHACLEKNRSRRPQTARDLTALLDRVEASWSLAEAEAWWGRRQRDQAAAAAGQAAGLGSSRTSAAAAPSARTSAGFDQTLAVDDRGN